MSHFLRKGVLSTVSILILFVGLVLVSGTSVLGKTKVVTPPNDGKSSIESVNPSDQSITISFSDKHTTTYTVGDFTQISVLGQTGKFSDLKAGQEVLAYVEGSGGTLDSISVGDTVSQPASSKASKKKAKTT